MSVTQSSIRAYLFIIASEFKTTDNTELELINTLIDDAMSSHNEIDLGSSYKKAIAYYVAHQLKISSFTPATPVTGGSGSTASQEVTKKKVGNIEISYSSNTVRKTQTITSGIESTNYGVMYQECMKNVINLPIYI